MTLLAPSTAFGSAIREVVWRFTGASFVSAVSSFHAWSYDTRPNQQRCDAHDQDQSGDLGKCDRRPPLARHIKTLPREARA
jgi:hypothetical protein